MGNKEAPNRGSVLTGGLRLGGDRRIGDDHNRFGEAVERWQASPPAHG